MSAKILDINHIFNKRWEHESDMLEMVKSLLPNNQHLSTQDRIRLCFECVYYKFRDILQILLPFWPTENFPYSITIHHRFEVNDVFVELMCNPIAAAYRQALMDREIDLKFAWLSFDNSLRLQNWVRNPIQMRADLHWRLVRFWTGPVRQHIQARAAMYRRVADTATVTVSDLLSVHPSMVPKAEQVLHTLLQSHEAVLEVRGLAQSPLFVENPWFRYLLEKTAYPALHVLVDTIGTHVNPTWVENTVFDLLYAPYIPQRLLAKQLRRLHTLSCRGFPTQLYLFVDILTCRDIHFNSQNTALLLRLSLHHEKALPLFLKPVRWSKRSVDMLADAMTPQELQHVRRASGDSLFTVLERSRIFQMRLLEETLVAMVRLRRFVNTVIAQKPRGECVICMDTHTLYALHTGEGVHCHRTCWECRRTLLRSPVQPRCPLCRVDLPWTPKPISTIGKWYLSRYHSEMRYDYDEPVSDWDSEEEGFDNENNDW